MSKIDYSIRQTDFEGYGCTAKKDGYYLSVPLYCKDDCGLFLYDLITEEEVLKIPFLPEYANGSIYSIVLSGIDFSKYGYKYYDEKEVFIDRYSKRIAKGENRFECSLFYDFDKKGKSEHVFIPFEEAVFYLAHVKGFTKADSQFKQNAGTFDAFKKKIPYLTGLGITSVILMPVYASLHEKEVSYKLVQGKEKPNYWGFGRAAHFAIKEEFAYSSEPEKEFKNLVKAFHAKNMECILMMNFSEADTEYILSVLRFYKNTYGVDGFRLLGENLPYEAIIKDPMLSDIKLLTNDVNLDYFAVRKNQAKRLCDVGDTFLKNARCFLKGDEDKVQYFSFAVRENHTKFSVMRNITDFSGFTLLDLVSYNRKHNEANDEDNTDGTDYNFSWNCGVEGTTQKKSINNLRMRQIKNALLLTFLCQCPPMLVAGDESLNSTGGNNNPYCQDNETGWVTYSKTKSAKKLYDFIANLIAFRKRHVILHQPKELMMFDYMSCRLPDISFHSSEAFRFDQTPASREFGILYCGEYSRQYIKKTEPSIYVIYNMNWEERDFVMPLTDGTWTKLYSTDGSTDESFLEEKAETVTDTVYKAAPRSVTVMLFNKNITA